MKATSFLLALWLLPLPGAAPEEMAVRRAEAEMAERPRDAFLIARQAAAKLAQEPALVRRLFREAARRQEAHLTLLDEPQVADLAAYYAGQSGDRAAAVRVQRHWLTGRRERLGPGRSAERLQLARLAWQWLKDRELAAGLCLEALEADPDQPGATRMLHDELGYRRTDHGWLPPEQATGQQEAVRPGMTAAEVRRLKGGPGRIARQHVNRRYLEQWIYEEPTSFRVEFQGTRGQELRVLRAYPTLPENGKK